MRKILSVVSSIALAVAFVGLGFLACVAPPTTRLLSNAFSDDATSPLGRTALSDVAMATRDYAFGAHSKEDLFRAIYDVDAEYQQKVGDMAGSLPAGFPNLSLVGNPTDLGQLAAAFEGASERYCYPPDTVSHLDDCHRLASVAYTLIAVLAAVGAAGLVLVGIFGKRRAVGRVLMAAGIVVVVAFAAMGVWAFVDFTGFFATFHGVFFSQGNWTFPYDSLLICALPTAFWAGMGIVWLTVSALASALSIAVGAKLAKR